MKIRTILSALLLMAAGIVSAQNAGVKIAPKYQAGDNKLYRSTISISAAGQTVNMTCETRYVVTEATPEGYTIEATIETVQTDAKDFMGRVLAMMQEVNKGVKNIVATDASGKVTGIKNFDEVKTNAEAAIEKLLSKLMTEMPEMAEMMPKDALKAQAMAAMTEERVLNTLSYSPSPLALNGKTIATGMVEESKDEQGRKVKNMYFLGSADGRQVKVTTTLSMTKDEMKQLIIEQVKQMAPEQADIVEQNIDMMMQAGVANFAMNQTADYTFRSDGWATAISVDQKQEVMGQTTAANFKMELVSE